MALKVGELFASFNVDTSGVSSAVNSIEKTLAGVGKNLMIGGAAMTAAVTVPLKKAAGEIYKAGSDFDAQMSKVFAIAGDEVTGSAEAMASLRAAAIEMGSTTSFTASEAGEALQYMAMAGWKTDQMLAGLAPIMNLAAASGEDLGTVSDIVTDALTAFGLTAADTAHFADVLAAASSNSNTNVAIMGESFKYIAPLAGSLGYSVDDVAVALGLMANAGIKGSMAGTSLRQVLSNLISPTDSQALAMQRLGVSLYDSNGKVKDFAELMGDLRRSAQESGFDMQKLRSQVSELDEQLANGAITEAEYDAQIQALTNGNDDFLKAISDLAGARGLSGLLAIMNATEEDFIKLTKAVAGSTDAASKMSKVMLDNAKGDVTLFKSALEGLEITLWGLSEGGFRKAVQGATEYVNAFRNADNETQTGTLRMAALAAATGPAMAGLGSIITLLPKLARTFTFVSGPAGMLTIGLVALGAAAIDSNNSIGKTFAKGMSKAGSKVRQFGKNVTKQLPEITKRMGAFLESVSAGISEGLPGLMDGLGDILSTGISALAKNMKNIGTVAQTLVRTLAQGIKQNLPQIASAAVDLLVELSTALIRNMPVVLEGISTVVTSLVKEIGETDWGDIGSNLSTAIQTSVKEIGVWFKKLAMGDKYVEDAGWDQVGIALVENILSGMQKALGNARDFIGKLLLGDNYSPDDSWSEFGTQIVDKIFDVGDAALAGGAEFVKGIIAGIGKVFSTENIQAASETIQEIVKRILSRATELIANLGTYAADIITAIGNVLFGTNDDGDSVVSLGVDALTGIMTTILETISTEIIPTLGGLVGNILGAIGNLFSKENGKALGDSLKNLGLSIIRGLTDAIVGIVDAVTGVVDKTNIDGLQETAFSIFESLAGGLIDAVVYAVPKLGTAAAKLIDAIAGLFSKENLDKAFKSVEKVVDGAESSGLIDVVFNAVGNILDSISGALGSAVGLGAELVKKLLELFGKIFSAENIKKVFDLASKAVETVGQSGLIDAVLGAVGSIIESIGNLLTKENLDAIFTGINTLFRNILERITDVVTSGKLNDVVNNIMTAIANLFSKENIGSLLDAINSLANNILTAIKDLISSGKLTDMIKDIISSIGNALSNIASNTDEIFQGGVDLARGIMDAIAAGIRQLPSIASTLFDALGGMLASLVESLKTIDAGELGKQAAEGLEGIIDATAEASADEGMSNSFSAFAQNLGTAIGEALKFAFNYAVGFVGELADYLFTKGGLRKIFEAGWNIGKMLLRGLWNAIKGLAETLGNYIYDAIVSLGDYIKNAWTGIYANAPSWMQTAMDKMGIAPKFEEMNDDMAAYLEYLRGFDIELVGPPTAQASYDASDWKAITDYLQESGYELEDANQAAMAMYEAMYLFSDTLDGNAAKGYFDLFFGDNMSIGKRMIQDVNEYLAENYNPDDPDVNYYEVKEWLQSYIEGIYDQVFAPMEDPDGYIHLGFAQYKRNDFIEMFASYLRKYESNGTGLFGDPMNLINFLWSTVGDVDDAAVRQAFENGTYSKKIEDYFKLLSYLFDDTVEAAATQAFEMPDARTAEGWTANYIPRDGTVTVDAPPGFEVDTTGLEEEFQRELEENEFQFSEESARGFAGAITEGEQPATEAANEVTNAVVQAYLLTMSSENGNKIGTTFVAAIITGMTGQQEAFIGIATASGEAVVAALSAAASQASGFTIGENFGLGFVNGIASMIAGAAAAASELGAAAGNALSGIIQEGSPSKLTGQSGDNFGLGFINHILASVDDAGEAAALMGASAAESLDATISEIRSTAANDMSLPVRHLPSQAEIQAVESEKNAQQIATAIADALNGCTVEMDGEAVGTLVMPTVSERIAAESESKRWGTV